MSGHKPIPFFDLPAILAPHHDELSVAWQAMLVRGDFVGGTELERFETEFAEYCETSHCVGVANGTDALQLILAASGVGPGDAVIVPANTFIATAEAVCAVGAVPQFVDVLPDTLLIDPAAVVAAVRPATVAIIAVHLFGQVADMDRLSEIARRHGLLLIEDAAQAHGARFAGIRAGALGAAGAFSFYPSKNLGALGDGGAVVSKHADLVARVRTLANHGRSEGDRFRHGMRGRNSRLDSLQAAILAIRLRHLDTENYRRQELAAKYRAELSAHTPIVAVHPKAEAVYHLFVVQVDNRRRVMNALCEANIGWGLHYPIPCHRQPAFVEFNEPLPVAEAAANQILSLPMFPSLKVDDVSTVSEVVRSAV